MRGTQKVTTSPSRRRPVRQNGAAIRALREKDGYSQQGLAKAAHITQTALSAIERDAASAYVTTLNRIARALCVPVSAIIRDADEAAEPAGDDPEPETAQAA